MVLAVEDAMCHAFEKSEVGFEVGHLDGSSEVRFGEGREEGFFGGVRFAEVVEENFEGGLLLELGTIEGLRRESAEQVKLGVAGVVKGVQHLWILLRGRTGGDGRKELVISPGAW
jgi:hypothetical protein